MGIGLCATRRDAMLSTLGYDLAMTLVLERAMILCEKATR